MNRHDSDILNLAIPALAGLAADPLVSLVDTAFVGHLGATQQGALGVNASIFSMAFVIFNFLAYGTTPRVGKAVGRGDTDDASDVVMQALVLAVGLGFGALALIQALAHPILWVMGATGELFEPALTYLRIRACAGPAVLLINAGRGAFRGYQDTRTPMMVTIGFNIINLTLDPILIFGLGWGLAGAAVATVVAQWLGALTFVYLLLSWRRDALGIVPRWPSVADLAPFFRIASDMLVRTSALIGTMTLATAVATRVGTTEVAAHQVVNQLWLFLALVVDALAVAAQALVSRHAGEDSPDEARSAGNRLLQWGVGVGCLLAVIVWFTGSILPPVFTDDPAVIDAIDHIWPFLAILQPINGLVFVWDGIYMGAEAFAFLAKAMVASAGIAAIVLLSVHPFDLGLAGVWTGITVLMITRIATLAVPWTRHNLID